MRVGPRRSQLDGWEPGSQPADTRAAGSAEADTNQPPTGSADLHRLNALDSVGGRSQLEGRTNTANDGKRSQRRRSQGHRADTPAPPDPPGPTAASRRRDPPTSTASTPWIVSEAGAREARRWPQRPPIGPLSAPYTPIDTPRNNSHLCRCRNDPGLRLDTPTPPRTECDTARSRPGRNHNTQLQWNKRNLWNWRSNSRK